MSATRYADKLVSLSERSAPLSSLVLSVLLASGCDDRAPSWVSLPPVEPGGSMVFALADTAGQRYFAADESELDLPAPFSWSGGPIEAFTYTRDLESLRIPPGSLPSVVNGSPLPPPDARFLLSVEEEAAPRWTTEAQTLTLDGLRTKLVSPCAEFEISRFSLGIGRPLLVEPLPDGRFLHGLRQTDTARMELTAIDRDGRSEALGTLSPPYISAGTVFGDSLWLGDEAGVIRRAPLSDLTNTSTHSTTLTAEPIGAIAVESREGDLVITTLTYGGSLERYSNGSWRILHREAPSENDEFELLRLPDGAYLAGVPLFASVLYEKDDVVAKEPLTGSGGPASIAVVRGEPVVGFTSGEIFMRREGVWSLLAQSPTSVEVYAFAEVGEDFFIAGNGGFFTEYNRELGDFCPPTTLDGYSSIQFVRPLGVDLLVVGRPVRNRFAAPYDILRRRP